jgi:hypothetical protein
LLLERADPTRSRRFVFVDENSKPQIREDKEIVFGMEAIQKRNVV